MSCGCGAALMLRSGHRPFQSARRRHRQQQQQQRMATSCRGGSRQQDSAPSEQPCPKQGVQQALAALLAALQVAGAPLATQLAAPTPAAAVLNSPNARIARRCLARLFWACSVPAT